MLVKLSVDTVLPARAVDTASLMAGVRVTMILWTRPPSLALSEAVLTLVTLLTVVWPPKLPLLPLELEKLVLEALEPVWRALENRRVFDSFRAYF